ncbi:hypothetical protein C8R48DRAFT_714581 [Suillus tomentosus]|nr:hypothetical protein C8R48DRAFT_714581 [Suillus tomentosus]
MLSSGLFFLTLIHVIQSWRTAKGHLYSILVKHNMFYYACGLRESGLHIFPCPSVMIVVPKVLSAMNVLIPLLFSDVHKSHNIL